MINTVLREVNRNDLVQSLRVLVYAMYQKRQLTEENINYINFIIHSLDLEDAAETIYNIDSRFELPIENIIGDMTHYGARALLLLLTITSKVFKDSNLESYIKAEVNDTLPFDRAVRKEISNFSTAFLSLSTELYDTIFDVESTGFFGSKSKNDIEDYQKLFLVTQEHIDALEDDDKKTFVKILIYMMLEDREIDDIESGYLNLWSSSLNIEPVDQKEMQDYDNLPTERFSDIKSPWLNKFLIFAYLLSQESNDLQEFTRLSNFMRLSEVENEELENLKKLVQKYKVNHVKLWEIIHSRIHLLEDQESNARYAYLALSLAEIVISYIPVVGPTISNINKFRHVTGKIVEDRSCNIMNFGLSDINKNTKSDTIVICIDGFMSESNAEQFKDWADGLESLKSSSWLKGYMWASNNFKTIISGGVSSWYESVSNTEKAATALLNDITTIYSFRPDVKIILMGHSLGARVIYNMLIKLHKHDFKVYEVYLFGGAVSRNNKAGWLSALSTVDKKIYNYYSSNDDILKKLYCSTMAGDDPIGLGKIEYFSSVDSKMAELKNIDCTDVIGGHTEYKDKLTSLMSKVS